MQWHPMELLFVRALQLRLVIFSRSTLSMNIVEEYNCIDLGNLSLILNVCSSTKVRWFIVADKDLLLYICHKF